MVWCKLSWRSQSPAVNSALYLFLERVIEDERACCDGKVPDPSCIGGHDWRNECVYVSQTGMVVEKARVSMSYSLPYLVFRESHASGTSRAMQARSITEYALLPFLMPIGETLLRLSLVTRVNSNNRRLEELYS